jgi:hypothetical protein
MNKRSLASGSGLLNLDIKNYGNRSEGEQDIWLDLPLLGLDQSFLSESTLAHVEEMDAEDSANGTPKVEQNDQLADTSMDADTDTDTFMASTVTLNGHHRSTHRFERHDQMDVIAGDIDTSLDDTSLSLYSEPSFSTRSRSGYYEDPSFAINITEPSFIIDDLSDSALSPVQSPQKGGTSMKSSKKILGDLLGFGFGRVNRLKGTDEGHSLSPELESLTPKLMPMVLEISPSLDTLVLEEDEARWAEEVKEMLGKVSANPKLDYGGAGNGVFDDFSVKNVTPQVVRVSVA